MDNITKDIQELEKMHTLSQNTSKEVIAAKLDDKPVKDVEESLSSFTKHTFDVIGEEYDFHKLLEAELANRLPNMSDNQLITLHTNNAVNLNDRISKVLGPTFQLMTAKQQAEISARVQAEKNQVNIAIGQGATSSQMKSLNENIGGKPEEAQAVLQGMTQLVSLLGGLGKKPVVTEDAEVIKED